MKIFIQLGILLLTFTRMFGQENLPPAFVIKSDSGFSVRLPDSNWQLLEDPNGKINFEEVSATTGSSGFRYPARGGNVHNAGTRAYWFRYVLKNGMDRQTTVMLGDNTFSPLPFFTPSEEQSDFYIIRADGHAIRMTNGLLTPWKMLDGIKAYRLIPLTLQPGEQVTIYRRIYNTYKFYSSTEGQDFWVGFGLYEKTTAEIFSHEEQKYFIGLHNSFIVGVLFFAGIFFCLFYAVDREKVYLYFSLYLLSLAIGRFNIYGEMYQTTFREHPVAYVYLFQFIWFGALFFLLQFVRYLLHTNELLPRWDKLLIGLGILFASIFILSIFVNFAFHYNPIINSILNDCNILVVIAIPVTFLLSARNFKRNKVLINVILPLVCLWCMLFLIFSMSVYSNTGWLRWVRSNWHGIESVLLVLLVISYSWILLNRFVDLRKQVAQANLEKEIEKSKLIERQKIELEDQVAKRTAELKHSLEDLKATQDQLIQKEKMASLGELTAGIAHEIQNPLNFINNFAGLNEELIDELNQHLKDGNYVEAERLASSVKENDKKIVQHGARADGIVKGMLQHSRSQSGHKEPTDINKICDEYLRLSYYGLRARDGNLKVNIETDYDMTLQKIPLNYQDFGRVLLNLFNNAFYAVMERKKKLGDSFSPEVSVKTVMEGERVKISIQDNGGGIPSEIQKKIFQPFFTTKPTGQGTGLGLSLSYDIITKAHGGELTLKESDGEHTEFSIVLPIT